MSATGRRKKNGPKTERKNQDFYETPEWCTRAALNGIPELMQLSRADRATQHATWLDPCAGHGAIIKAARLVYPEIVWHGVEIRQEAQPHLEELKVPYRIQDFLNPGGIAFPMAPRYDVIFTNPPCKLALPFVQRGLEMADHVVMLLRLNFLAGQKRSVWMRDNMPDVYVLPKRPSFDADGTDACEYAWMHWRARDLNMRMVGNVEILSLEGIDGI